MGVTNQEAFDKVVRHLLTQIERSVGPDGRCLYRGPRGLRCAVGCLIPEDQYLWDFEGYDSDHVAQRVPALSGVSIFLLTALQRVHDREALEHWPVELEAVANILGLAMPEVP
jgi:hypothetical protein